MTLNLNRADGIAIKRKTAFRLDYAVGIEIDAATDRIWSILTDASDYPSWNSTIISLKGTIESGSRIRLTATLDPGRTFRLKVARFEPPRIMVWTSGAAPMFRGVRTFTLGHTANGMVQFAMEEAFSGLMLPLIAGSLPDFSSAFQQFAADLKTAAEVKSMP